jgi:hypothetical protein
VPKKNKHSAIAGMSRGDSVGGDRHVEQDDTDVRGVLLKDHYALGT